MSWAQTITRHGGTAHRKRHKNAMEQTGQIGWQQGCIIVNRKLKGSIEGYEVIWTEMISVMTSGIITEEKWHFGCKRKLR